MINDQNDKPWWSEEYGFFGDFYMEGDSSNEGYLIEKKQTLGERTSTEVDGIIKLLHLKPNDRLLDCPCGYGRHSIELASRNIKVTGSDINSKHLSKAKNDANKRDIKLSFNQESMIDLRYGLEFDAVINMFYSFGFFETDEENNKVLKNFYNSLKPGGRFLMHTDVNIPRILSKKYKEDEERKLTTGNTLRVIDNYDENTKRINGAWIIKKNEQEERKDYSVRVYTKEEFEQMCSNVGFTKVTTYSNWDGDIYSEESEDMIVVAEK